MITEPQCFPAGTKLLTPSGYRAIETLQVGDEVYSRDEHDVNGPIEPKRVKQTFIRAGTSFELEIANQRFRTTPEHPFYVVGRGWCPAGQLEVGDPLLSHDGHIVHVTRKDFELTVETVYNVEIEDWHTYFVGEVGWGFSVWTHNAACGESVRLALEAEGISIPKGDPRLDAIAKHINDGKLGAARNAINDLAPGTQISGKRMTGILDAAENPPVRGTPTVPPATQDPELPTAPQRGAANPNWMREQGWEPISGRPGHFRRADGAMLDTNTAGEVGKLPHYDMTLPDGRRIKLDPANGEAPGNATFLRPEQRNPEGGGAMDDKQQRRKGFDDRE